MKCAELFFLADTRPLMTKVDTLMAILAVAHLVDLGHILGEEGLECQIRAHF